MVSSSTLRGVLGVGGAGSALATAEVAETATGVLASGAKTGEDAGLGGVGSVLHDQAQIAITESAEILGNRADFRNTL
jgi:hypothetical protein